jgi:putative addiction module component (TIGR02574 family)
MATIAEAEEMALSLTDNERAQLAERLLSSLPGVLVDEDGGVEEALRRDAEMDTDPKKIISHDEFLEFFRNRSR